ncbi:MAG: aminopeptidase P family protein [Oscillospiraceae bacterium]|nr:aminopeptidase P family protein [Oscillospiraceae bacterium]
MIPQRLEKLRGLMAQRGINAYVIPTSDFHESEYVGDYFKARKYMSGFTGSAGTLVVTAKEACLWTDGRYFIQAANQLKDTTVTLMKMGEEGTPTIEEYLYHAVPAHGKLGFDGRVITAALGRGFTEKLADKKATLFTGEDLVDLIWEGRPALSAEPAFLLDEKYAGKSAAQKLAELREEMQKDGCTAHVITTLDDIAWLFNIRGNDVECNPVVLSYAVITLKKAHLFVNSACLNDEIQAKLAADGVKVHGYDKMIPFVKKMSAKETVLLDPQKVSYEIDAAIRGKKVEKANPTQLAKAMKNPVELENIRNVHVKDGVAFTKFMYWLKTNVGKIPMTEISAADYLLARRAEQEGFIEPSFGTIAAYKANAAMMHYSATEESNAVLEPEGMLLVDSGGQYYEGTTDITRTMVLGPITDEQKLHFTTVLRSNLDLANARFLYGCVGMNLDILARGPIWDLGLDYKCGTGHGIGYLLNVHEAPNGFRWRIVAERRDSAVLEEGMVTTDEPGIYIEGSHGIRTENELICRKGVKNHDGQFMYFEPVTYAPIDLDGIDPRYLTEKERQTLNDYHAMVYGKLFDYLTDEERAWLKEYTRSI